MSLPKLIRQAADCTTDPGGLSLSTHTEPEGATGGLLCSATFANDGRAVTGAAVAAAEARPDGLAGGSMEGVTETGAAREVAVYTL